MEDNSDKPVLVDRTSSHVDDEDISSVGPESFLDDDSSRNDGSSNGEMKKKKQGQDIAQKESRAVHFVRFLVVVLLLGVTAAVAMGVYVYVSGSESSDFEDEFEDSSEKVLDAIGSTLEQSLGAMDNFMVSIVANTEKTNQTFPFATIPDFGVRASKVLSLSKAFEFGVYPKVSGDQRSRWEEWAQDHDEWIDESLAVQREDPTYEGINVDTWSPSTSLSGSSGPLPVDMPGPHYPTYYSAPIAPVLSTYGWDIYQQYSSQLDAMEQQRTATMGKTINVADPNDEQEQREETFYQSWMSGFIGPDRNPTEPFVAVFYPLVEGANDGVSLAEESVVDHAIVGTIAMTIFWQELFTNILSTGNDGITVVIDNGCYTPVTYSIRGPNAEFVGRGDLHDRKYDDMKKEASMHELLSGTSSDRSYTGFPLSSEFCPYFFSLYASDEMRDDHESNNPIIFTIVAICIFAFTSLVFCLYDCVSERRQRKVLRAAMQSTAVVSSLFPQVVRDRVFPTTDDKNKKATLDRVENAKLRLQQFLKSDGDGKNDGAATKDGDTSEDAPIAELFSETTVMFADIAGFTAWSSVREPAQVFTLLESLYGAFDKIARRRKVFKVETIGDSYVAVCGLPEPRKDHALVMAKFARDCREKVDELTKTLARTLGPDTAELQIRIGLNSGPVTAGVLRGERSRFQLFGDTVNTAARMESTGAVSKIQVSRSTAELIRQGQKGHWLTMREGGIEAKGKGQVQTWFVEPSSHASSNSSGSEVLDDKDFQTMDDKTRRLVDWNVEIMTKLLKQIVARREAWQNIGRKGFANNSRNSNSVTRTSSSHGASGKTVLDEVLEVIELPEFDHRLVQHSTEPSKVVLSTPVMTQLREFVSIIASMYRSNPFHNFEHASHVTMSVVKLLSRIGAPSEDIIESTQEKKGGLASRLHDHTYGITSDPLTQFACVFSALIHDVDHQGVPNTQLMVEKSLLVEMYKGKSLAEQNSVDLSWRLLLDDQFEDLRNIIASSPNEMDHFRHLVVNSVMATDIMDKDLKALRNARWEKAFSEGSRLGESKQTNINRKATIVIEHLIQASDVAHTMQHWHIYRKWNENLFKEMYYAYKAGRSEKNPAEFWYKGEMGFFDFYIIPLARKLKECGVFGVSSDEYLSYAMKNREEWERRGQETVAGMVQKLEPAHIEDIPDDGLHEEEK